MGSLLSKTPQLLSGEAPAEHESGRIHHAATFAPPTDPWSVVFFFGVLMTGLGGTDS